ncbi:MAG: DUF3999 family protein, partial [Burkholderiaceae bacterium]
MRALDVWRAAFACACACAWATAAAGDDEVVYRHSASIEVVQAAPFVRIALPPSTYGRTEQAELRDLRLVDAGGERVPFALLLPRSAAAESTEQQREAKLFPLPARPAAG